MRVEAFNKVAQAYNLNSTKKTSQVNKIEQTDKLQISQFGKDYQIAKQAVANASDIREDRINDIKSRVSSGTYNITSEEFANKITNNYFNAIV